MTRVVVDTNIFVRALTRDHPVQSAASQDLFHRAERGEVSLATSEAVVAEVCYVLTSRALYGIDRATAAKLLRPILGLRSLHIPDRALMLAALDRWSTSNQPKFVDCVVIERALGGDGLVYSYDRGLDRVAGLIRREP